MARKTSFYYSFLVLPRRAAPRDHRGLGLLPRRGRCGGRGAGGAGGALPAGREAVAFWRDGAGALLRRRRRRATPQGRRLQPFVAQFDLPRQAFEDVIDGVAMDLDTTRYETFDELFEYCRRVASAVGLICIRIFGCRERAGARVRAEPRRRAAADQHPARRQGRSARGRVYLPLEDLRGGRLHGRGSRGRAR